MKVVAVVAAFLGGLLFQAVVIEPLRAGSLDIGVAIAVFSGLMLAAAVANQELKNRKW